MFVVFPAMLLLSVWLVATMYFRCQRHLPSNRLVRHVRSRAGLRLGVPVMVLGVGYFVVGVACARLVEAGELGWLNLAVIVCWWNALKLVGHGLIAIIALLIVRVREKVAAHREAGDDMPQLWTTTSGHAHARSTPSYQERDRSRGLADHAAVVNAGGGRRGAHLWWVTVSMRVLSAGEGYRYLLKTVAAGDGDRAISTPLTRYYQEKGTPPGRWLGAGVAGLGDGSLAPGDVVTEEQLRRLLGHGHDPITGAPLGRSYYRFKSLAERVAIRLARLDPGLDPGDRATRVEQFEVEEAERPRPRMVAGYDYTFSVPKSVSVLWAVADAGTKALLLRAHHDAVADVLALLERDVAMTRTGTGGVAQVDTRGVVATAYDHYDSRAGDPQLHTHVVIANRVQARDGKWRTLDGRPMHAAVVALSEHYNAVLADHLTRALGVRWERRSRGEDRNPVWEIAGVPEELIEEFSSRTADIEAEKDRLIAGYVAAHGWRPSRTTVLRLRQQATLATRPDKQVRSLAELTEEWRDRATTVVGEDAPTWAQHLITSSDHPVVVPADDLPLAEIDQLGGAVVDRVGATRSTWRRWNLHAEASRQTMGIRFTSTTDRDAVIGLIVDAAERRSLRLTPPDLTEVPAAFRRDDGSSVFRPKHGTVYSSTSVLEAERRLLELAATATAPTIARDVIARTSTRPGGRGLVLGPDQVQAVEQIATSGRVVDVLVGPAGTGKTTTLGALRRAWEQRHGAGSVVGLAPSAAAAEVLADDLGIRCENTAKWLYDHGRGRRALTSGQLVIIDEASLAGTFALDRIATHAAKVGAKLLLVGDWAQLDAIDTSGAFGLLVRSRDKAPELLDVRRLANSWEKSASLQLRLGHVEVIDTYDIHNRIRSGDHDAILDTAYQAWRTDIADGKTSVLIAESADTVTSLNARARHDRILTGEVTDDGARLADGNRAGQGDVVITRRNDRRLTTGRGWVKNGDLWTVTRHHRDGTLTIRRYGSPWRGSVTLPAWYVAKHLDLGYAVTAHRAQGSTVDTAHAIVNSPTMTRETFYVAMTRGRHANNAYVATDQPHLEDHQRTSDGEVAARDILTGILHHAGTELSAHETITAEQDTWTSIAQLAAEYETIAQHAQVERVTGLLDSADLSDQQVSQAVSSDSFGSLVAELRRVESNGHDPGHLVRRAVAAGPIGHADDLATLIRHRIQKYAAVTPRGTHARRAELIAGLVPKATGPMTHDEAASLADLESLIEQRADSLTTTALANHEPWTRRCGTRPTDPSRRAAWVHLLRTVVAYRDRHHITGTDPLGPVPATDLERLGYHRAATAVRRARTLSSARQPLSGAIPRADRVAAPER